MAANEASACARTARQGSLRRCQDEQGGLAHRRRGDGRRDLGLGLWWLDSLAAILISLDITHDGVNNLRTATSDLMDARPSLIDNSAMDPLPERLRTEISSATWVKDVAVRVREEGHVFFADIQVVPVATENLTSRLAALTPKLMDLDWRLHDVMIMPVDEIHAEVDAPTRSGGPTK